MYLNALLTPGIELAEWLIETWDVFKLSKDTGGAGAGAD